MQVSPAPADSFGAEIDSRDRWKSALPGLAYTRSRLELAIVEYVGWFNQARLHESLGDIPPAEFEADCTARTRHHDALFAEGGPSKDVRAA